MCYYKESILTRTDQNHRRKSYKRHHQGLVLLLLSLFDSEDPKLMSVLTIILRKVYIHTYCRFQDKEKKSSIDTLIGCEDNTKPHRNQTQLAVTQPMHHL